MNLPKLNRNHLGLLFFLIVIGSLSGLGIVFHKQILKAIKFILIYIEHNPKIGTVLYVLLLATWSAFMLPMFILHVIGGVLFKPLPFAVFIAYVAAQLGVLIAFGLCKTILKSWLQKKFGNSPKVKALNDAFREQGYKLVFLIRLTPMPFGLTNYLLAGTDIKLVAILFGTFGMVPSVFLQCMVGSFLSSINDDIKTPLRVTLLTVLIASTFAIGVFIFITLLAKRALRNVIDLETIEKETPVDSVPENVIPKQTKESPTSPKHLTNDKLTSTAIIKSLEANSHAKPDGGNSFGSDKSTSLMMERNDIQIENQPTQSKNSFTKREKLILMSVSVVMTISLSVGIPLILSNTTETGHKWGQ
ncbi:snare associated Golgi protein-domain-containing protein [Globomyces pollinis-pini]|nr:snare associated Golgi protein-domain-containing protein [Globomyces pollinis-pini]